MKVNLLALSIVLSFVLPVQSQDNDCKLNYTYRIEKSNNSTGKIYITLKSGKPEEEYSLWNLSLNKKVQESRKRLIPNQEVLIFENVPEGHYVINVKTSGCSFPTSIGGIKGIEIK